jgi:hypothetical protein
MGLYSDDLALSHDYITVGARRWCMGCNTFQRRRNGVWRDDEEMIGPAWPAYEITQDECQARNVQKPTTECDQWQLDL